jgi:hypothetical protein
VGVHGVSSGFVLARKLKLHEAKACGVHGVSSGFVLARKLKLHEAKETMKAGSPKNGRKLDKVSNSKRA